MEGNGYNTVMKLAFIGLGRMGGNMVRKLIADGHDLIVWNRSANPIEQLRYDLLQNNEYSEKVINDVLYIVHETGRGSLTVAKDVKSLADLLESPRIVWSMLPSGQVTEDMLLEIQKYISAQDIVIDGSNSNYKETQRHFDEFTKKGIKFLGIGVAGGIVGPKKGYAMMAGGDESAYEFVTPILDTLAKPEAGHAYFGSGGAGHFVKMIHNGIEYGIMQALAEGFDVLEHAPYTFDLLKIGKLWQRSSLVAGFMLDRAVEALEEDPHMEQISGLIDATGEAKWTIEQAKEEGVAVEIIEHSLDYRTRSKTDLKIQNSYTAKMVAALRNKFGGHKVEKK